MAEDYGTLSPYSDLYQPSASELARNRAGAGADRPGYSHLGSALGSMFFGGGARQERADKIFNEAATGQVKLEDLIMQATKDRDAQIGRQGAIQRALDAGRSDIADMIRNSPNAASAGEAALHEQARGWGDKSWELANSPEGATDAGIEQLVRQAGVRAPASMKDATKIEGGVGVSPFRTPGDQPGQFETPESKSLGKLHAAQATEAGARTTYITGPQTEAEKALTEQRKRGPAGRGGTTDLPAADLKLLFSDGAGGQDDAAIKDFKIWMTDNNLTNERTSIGRYLKEQRAKAPATPTADAPVEQPSTIRGLFESVTGGKGWGGPGAATASAPSDAAIAYLKKNAGDPAIRDQFKQKYGQDPATYIQGGDVGVTVRKKLQAAPEE